MDRTRVVAAVERAFTETGAGTPPWPNRHLGGGQPREEEYSRCLDPGKYRILAARAEAWVRALTGLGLATRDDGADPVAAWRDGAPPPVLTRATWVRPRRTDAVPLLVAAGPIHSTPDAVLCLGAGDPAVLVLWTPDCGCDACDSGSESLLEELDDHVWAVISGTYVHVTTRDTTVSSTGSGWSAGSRGRRRPSVPEVERLLAEARAGRSRHRTVSGAAWG